MFIAHLPLGYITAQFAISRYQVQPNLQKKLLFVTLLASVLPDFDLFYFYLVDSSKHHHLYFPHIPIFWLVLFAIVGLWLYIRKSVSMIFFALFAINISLHIMLDSLVGDIWWLYPWVDQPYALFTVPAVYQTWWLNFVVHWTFAVELLILAIAIIVWRKNNYRLFVTQ